MSSHQMSVHELAEARVKNESLVLLDVRTAPERAEGHIGGLHIPLDRLPQQLDQLPSDKPILVYCRSGQRSLAAQTFLISMGWSSVFNLIGGIEAWAREFAINFEHIKPTG